MLKFTQNTMEAPFAKSTQSTHDAIEAWDDDGDFQGLDDFHFRNASSTTIASNKPTHRDSVSSRVSMRSDKESIGAGEDDWQVLLAEEDEKSMTEAITSAKTAGIPIPQNVPSSALLGGTIKRLGGKKLKKVMGEDWGDDIDIPRAQDGGLTLRKKDDYTFPDALHLFDNEPTPAINPSKPGKEPTVLQRLRTLTTTGGSAAASLDKFKDDDDDFFGDVPTIRLNKKRPAADKLNLFPAQPTSETPAAENMEDGLEFPDGNQPLRLSLRKDTPKTPSSLVTDEFDLDWAESSLGTRFGGTKRDVRSNPSSSITFSPSASSCLTAESEDDGLDGLVLPHSSFKFGDALKKRMETTLDECPSPQFDKASPLKSDRKDNTKEDDFFTEIEIGDGEVFDSGKLTLNQNIKQKPARQTSPVRRTATTITFTNKLEPGVSKIPRLQVHDRNRSNLESVSESGPAAQYKRPASRFGNHSNQSSTASAIPTPSTPSGSQKTATATPTRRTLAKKSSQDLLRSQNPPANPPKYLNPKRSMPMLSQKQISPGTKQGIRPPSRAGDARPAIPSRPKTPIDRSGAESSMSNARRQPVPFLPAGTSHAQSHHVSLKSSRTFNRPTSSDSNENTISSRPISRLSHLHRPTTPNNNRRAPEKLLKEAASKRTLTKPLRKAAFGDGNELDMFDDLPTSAMSESKYVKQPIARGAPRSTQSRGRLGMQLGNASTSSINLDQSPSVVTSPPTPVKQENIPRFARDTNASRMAREQRIGSVSATLHSNSGLPTVRENGGPLSAVSTNWRPPSRITQKNSASPMSHSKRRNKLPPQKPRLIKPIGEVHTHPREEKGMQWNPVLLRWEGNENALTPFDAPATSTVLLGAASSPMTSPRSPATVGSISRAKAAPALIANVGAAAQGVQMSGGMVFDPQRMCWLKANASSHPIASQNNTLSPTTQPEDDEDDPFAGIEDLDDGPTNKRPSVAGSALSRGSTADPFGPPIGSAQRNDSIDGIASSSGAFEEETLGPISIGEEFDVGPEFIKRQRAEEERWRAKVAGWVGRGVQRDDNDGRGWRWAIREKASRPA